MASEGKDTKNVIVVMMIFIVTMDKSQAIEKSDQNNITHTFRSPACDGNHNCTNIFSEDCYNEFATFICCEGDYRVIDLKNCTEAFRCNFLTEECFNDLLVANFLKQNPCNNSDAHLIKAVAHDTWNYISSGKI